MKNNYSTFKIVMKLIGLLGPYRRIVFGAMALLLFYSALKLATPWAIKILLDDVLSGGHYDWLAPICGGLLGIAMLVAVSGFGYSYLSLAFSARFATDLAVNTYRRLQALSLADVREIKTGEAMNAVMNDPQVVSSGMFGLAYNFVRSLALLVLSCAVLFYINWVLTLIVLGIFGAYSLFYFLWLGRLRAGYKSIRDETARLTGRVQEIIRDFAVVKAYGAEKRELIKYVRGTNNLLRSKLGVYRMHSGFIAMHEFFAALGLITVLWYGVTEIEHGRLSIGELVAFYGYLALVVEPVLGLTNLLGTLQQLAVSAERIFAVTERVPGVREAAEPVEPSELNGGVSFENVSFKYDACVENNEPDKRPDALCGVSFEAKPGEHIALVGPTGSGKSTIAYLIARLYDTTGGTVKIDGRDIKMLKQSWFRKHLAIVTQETLLFEGTIRDNIAFSKPHASLDEVVDASKAAGLHEFVSALPGGYDTVVGEAGQKISGGQRQLLSIARAFLANPKILILDEPASALDAHTEEQFRLGLNKLSRGCTTFIIAHRLTAVLDADRILYIENGRIIESGSHDSLLRKNGTYARLYSSQFQSLKDKN